MSMVDQTHHCPVFDIDTIDVDGIIIGIDIGIDATKLVVVPAFIMSNGVVCKLCNQTSDQPVIT